MTWSDPTVIAAIIAACASVMAAYIGRTNQKKLKSLEETYWIHQSQRMWKEKSVSELLGPVHMLLIRSEKISEKVKAPRTPGKDTTPDLEIMAKCNSKIRDLLLEKGHLIPTGLIPDASKLIEHYDYWLEAYEEKKHAEFFQREMFPTQSADNFRKRFKVYWNELYSDNTT